MGGSGGGHGVGIFITGCHKWNLNFPPISDLIFQNGSAQHTTKLFVSKRKKGPNLHHSQRLNYGALAAGLEF